MSKEERAHGKRRASSDAAEAAADVAMKRRRSDVSNGSEADDDTMEDAAGGIDFDDLCGDEDGGLDDASLLASMAWPRPAVSIDFGKDPIVFQQMDIEQWSMPQPLPGIEVGNTRGTVPIIRMYGVTAQGNSVAAFVHGYLPYFYVPAPEDMSGSECSAFRTALEKRLQASPPQYVNGVPEYVLKVEIVMRESIMHYHAAGKIKFLRIQVAMPKVVPAARRILSDGFAFNGRPVRGYATYEANLEFTLRFMIDTDIVGGNWIELPAKHYRMRARKETRCQIEVDIAYDRVVSHAPDSADQWEAIAPLRQLSFDIECAGRRGVFPEPQIDPVIQIANLVTRQGESKPFVRNVFTLKSCAPIAGAHVLSYDTEKELLLGWKEFVCSVDPDIIVGYNTANFDLPYLVDRAAALGVKEFPFLGRMLKQQTVIKNTKFSSKAYGTRESKDTKMEGRVQLDMLQVIQRDHKLRSYTLNAVSAEFLGEQKEDVHHSIITDLQNGNDETRRRLAVYCIKDAYLPQRLMDKLMVLINYTEMARVTGVPINYLLSRGQQIKVVSQLYRKAKTKGLVIPVVDSAGQSDEVNYEGATVIDPLRGYYDDPISTLDFSSLYPSIMMAHNLCYSTLVSPASLKDVPSELYIKTPNGDHFVKTTVKKGILPEILEELLSARKRAKKDMKEAKDDFKRAVMNGRQLALKISANSVYGFTGATVGKLPCLEISSSVTAFGRMMIEETKQIVEDHYKIANGYEHDATVVYGDTDSVMIKFGTKDIGVAMKLGEEAAERVSKHFVKPIKLEFEKVYSPYLLINKKRYAGLLWTRPDKYDKIDAKGIETVRRDNAPLVKIVMEKCLHKILVERDVQGAIEDTKHVINDLLNNRVDLSMLVISKSLSRNAEDYANKQAHTELAKRMHKRDAGSAPTLGDRVAYVIVKAGVGAKGYEKAEDPLFVLEHNVPIDAQYYLDHQLSGPLTRIFEPIMDNPRLLFEGEHTRSVTKTAPATGGIMKFAVRSLTCLRCKAPISKAQGTVCKHCKPYEADVYQHQLHSTTALELEFSKLWSQCQRCQGSLHQDVLCSNNDCEIFYARKKVQKQLGSAHETLSRFGL